MLVIPKFKPGSVVGKQSEGALCGPISFIWVTPRENIGIVL